MCEIYYDGDSWDAFTHSMRKARRQHVCMSCRATIAIGEVYHYTSYVYDHSAGSEKMCAECSRDRDEFGKAHAFYPGARSFEEYLSECVAEDDEGDRAKWLPMLERLRARRVAAQEVAR